MNSAITVLMVAEKASIARSIAEALAGKGKYQPQKGKVDICPIMVWNGEFMGYLICQFQQYGNKSTSVAGHIFNRDFPEEYQDWRKHDPVALFDAPTVKKEANTDFNMIEHLKSESTNADYLVLWLDCDREGENICFEVIEVCQKQMKKLVIILQFQGDYGLQKAGQQQIYRGKFSSLTKEDLLMAFKNLKDGPNLNESQAVDARQIIDLKVGVAFTRFLSRFLLRKYEELSGNPVSFGPCQTPTIGFCVEQSEEIKKHVPRTIIQTEAIVQVDNKSFKLQQLTQQQQNLTKNDCLKIQKDLIGVKVMEVVKVEVNDLIVAKPNALNTIALLKLASSLLKVSPSDTMHVAEKLYVSGFITYPRTETTAYAQSFDFKTPLQVQDKNPQLGQLANQILNQGVNPNNKGTDSGDHPPITPTSKPALGLEGNELKFYELIVRYYMGSVSIDAVYVQTRVHLKAGQYIFILEGLQAKQLGFIQYMNWMAKAEKLLPPVKVGQQFQIKEVTIREEQVPPPKPLSEEQLINLMDKYKIGTDASMATHINTIQSRKYVELDQNSRELRTTLLGEALVKGLKAIDPDLCGPKLRSNMELQLDQIAKGKAKYEVVLQQVLDIFRKKYDNFTKNISKLDTYFEGVFQSVDQAISKLIQNIYPLQFFVDTAPLFTICGRCQNQMRLLSGKVFCEKCKCMFGLPKKQQFDRSNEFCNKDKFEFILTYYPDQKDNKTKWVKLCPMCNQQAFKDSQKPKNN